MGKASKSKEKGLDAKTSKGGKVEEEYEFKLPAFDESKFIRREVQNAKASFYTLAIGVAAGILAVLTYVAPIPWYWGWLPILGSMALLRGILTRMGFGEEATAWKALIGSYFMLFFTGLALWILGVNLV